MPRVLQLAAKRNHNQTMKRARIKSGWRIDGGSVDARPAPRVPRIEDFERADARARAALPRDNAGNLVDVQAYTVGKAIIANAIRADNPKQDKELAGWITMMDNLRFKEYAQEVGRRALGLL